MNEFDNFSLFSIEFLDENSEFDSKSSKEGSSEFLEDLSSVSDNDDNNMNNSNNNNNNTNRKKRRNVYIRNELARKRRNEQRRVNKIPRLLKHDIRRNYATMFMNMMNSGDEELINKYFHRFYIPNCSFEKISMKTNDLDNLLSSSMSSTISTTSSTMITNSSKTILLGCNNLENIIRFFMGCYEHFPDLFMKFHHVTVRQHYDENVSSIVGQFSMKGTKLKSKIIDYVDFLYFLSIQQKKLALLQQNQSVFYPPLSYPVIISDEYEEIYNIDELRAYLSHIPIQLLQSHLPSKEYLFSLPDKSVLMKPAQPFLELEMNGQMTFELNQDYMITRVETILMESTASITPINIL